MRESFQSLILHLVLTGIFIFCLCWLCVLIRKTIRQCLCLKPTSRTVFVLMVTVAALLAQKPNGEDDGIDDESDNYSRVENTIHAYEPWTLRGAADDWFILNFTNNWVFPHDSNHWTRCVVLTSGQVWDTTRGTNRLVAVGQQMSAVPDESCFTYELTDDNSYLLTWSNFFLNRDTNQPITASIELKRNGGWIATSNEVSVAHSRILPFAHNGFGQDADWVRANFTNAEEILSVGYSQWVDAQVGYNLTNGLYKFVATFADAPPEAVNLTVGDLSVVVTNAGDYAFLLEKGIDYTFNTRPHLTNVVWWAVDDVGPGEPAPSASYPWGNAATWTVDGGWLDFRLPTATTSGLINWLPLFYGTPDIGHLTFPTENPRFTAVLSDCRYADSAVYEWTGGTVDFEIQTPHDRETYLIFHNYPSWRRTSLSVTATFGGRTLVSCLDEFTYGTNDTPQVRLGLSTPSVVLVRDAARTNDTGIASLSLFFDSDVATNGTVRLSAANAERVALFSDSNCVNRVALPVDLDASAFNGAIYYLRGFEPSAAVGDIGWTAQFISGETNAVSGATTAVRIGDVRLPGAPNDGLVISQGTTVALEVDCEPVTAAMLLSVEWSVRRMRGNGTFSEWENAGATTNAVAHLYIPPTGGVYQVRAQVGADGWTSTRFFAWGEEPDTYGSRKKGDLKAFGVVDEEWQKTLRNTAHAMLGDTSYTLLTYLPSGNGFSGVGGDYKCNQFVARMIRSAGLTVPAMYGWIFSYPPVANDWANGTPIEDWQWLGRELFIQPGFVIGHPSGEGGSGHCGIVDFDGCGIGAGQNEINRHEWKWFDGTSGFNTYTETNEGD